MKKALVYVSGVRGHVVGTVSMMMDSAKMDEWTHDIVASGIVEKVDVPQNLQDLPESQLKGVFIEAQPQKWTSGQQTVFVEPEDLDGWTFHPAVSAHWEITTGPSYTTFDKTKRVSKKFKDLNDEVGAEMYQVYKTTNPDSAVANYLTWMAMKNSPSKFSNKGLVARFEVVGLSIGDALNTPKKVEDYATALLDLADQYAIWRELKIQTFISEKASIEAE